MKRGEMTGRRLDERTDPAVAAYLEAMKLGAMTPEARELWFRTTREGKALAVMLRRYDAAIAEHGPRMVPQ